MAGWGRKNQYLFLGQPFINYNLPKGRYPDTSFIFTADWNASHEDMWTVPVGGGVGKIVKVGGKLPINFHLTAYYNAVSPKNGADWQFQFQIQFMFPR